MTLPQQAEALAREAHKDQVDKAGRPYIEHVERVALAVRGDDVAEAVAWLHDVLEDCPRFHDDLWGFPAAVTRSVSTLTRIPGHDAEFYYSRIHSDPIALKVKLADIADNANEDRLALLDPTLRARLRLKYARALEMLGEPT